jgi:sigma-B regulation protein RsbU (phosphoserine phosphatase)
MPTLFYDAGEKKIIELNVGGGIPAFSFSDYEQDSMICKPADVLCVCSDGVTEAKDDHNNMLGLDAIKNFLADNSHLSSIEIAKGIFRMVKTHTENQRNHDDLSVLIVKRDLA